MLDIYGFSLTAEDRLLLEHPLIGGVLLFARNAEDFLQLKSLIKQIRLLNKPLLIAVDQEGGRVQRFHDGFTQLPACATFAENYQANLQTAARKAQANGLLMAQELLAIGINISFAPVLDLNYGKNDVIGNRSFGQDVQQVVALAGAYIAGMHQAGMAATGKHFPGHGFVTADSHLSLPIDPRSLADIAAADLQPFAQLAHQLQAIMPAHIIYEQVDSLPAGFSPKWLQDILRKKLRFNGAIISDDLNMAAAATAGDMPARFTAAMTAGCDMAIIANNRAGVISVLDQVGYVPTLNSQQRLSIMAGSKQ